MTKMRSASTTVCRRCAITIVVRPPAETLDRALHLTLGFGIERGRGLVEQDDRRVLEQRPRNRNALALAAGELGAMLAHLAHRSRAGNAMMKSCA